MKLTLKDNNCYVCYEVIANVFIEIITSVCYNNRD